MTGLSAVATTSRMMCMDSASSLCRWVSMVLCNQIKRCFGYCSSNFYKKNEYKKIRFNSFGLTPYKEKLILEDSSNIFNGYYKLEVPRNSNEKTINNKEIRKTYLVFYNNGKVARFLDYEEENLMVGALEEFPLPGR